MKSLLGPLRRFFVLTALLGHLAGTGLHALEHARHAEAAATACSDARDGHLHEGTELGHAPAHDCVQCQRSSGAAPAPQAAATSRRSASPGIAAPQAFHLLSATFLPAAPRRGPPTA